MFTSRTVPDEAIILSDDREHMKKNFAGLKSIRGLASGNSCFRIQTRLISWTVSAHFVPEVCKTNATRRNMHFCFVFA